MKLLFGGAYNGKLRYIREKLGINEDEIFYCKEDSIDFSKKVISGIDRLIYFNALQGKESLSFFKEKKELLKDKILICDEISSGIVPLKKEERLWREETGKVLQFLSKESEEVYRIFFGIGTRLKGE